MSTSFFAPQTEEERARICACKKPGHVRRMTTPAEGDRCAECFEEQAVCLAYARAHPKVIDANLAVGRAWDAYQAGRGLPMEEWCVLEKVWREAVDAATAAFVSACNEHKQRTKESATP
jgi:hypothetical protein